MDETHLDDNLPPNAPQVAAAPGSAEPGTTAPGPSTPVPPAPEGQDVEVERRMHAISRRSFLWAGAATTAFLAGWKWLDSTRQEEMVPWPFRRTLEFNERVATALFSESRLSPTFPVSRARVPRENGDEGMPDGFDPDNWKLHVEGLATPGKAGVRSATFTMDQIRALPHVEMVTEFKCIEGWSVIVHWGGARLADFVSRYPPATKSGSPADVVNRPGDLPDYVGMETPDQGYYVGLDRKSALHPQTLLCYEMNGRPLSLEHGAPLRLVIPVKYGVKNIKRIGTIRFTHDRPADFWAEQGYDWYAGH